MCFNHGLPLPTVEWMPYWTEEPNLAISKIDNRIRNLTFVSSVFYYYHILKFSSFISPVISQALEFTLTIKLPKDDFLFPLWLLAFKIVVLKCLLLAILP